MPDPESHTLSTCRKISKHQAVTDLYIGFVTYRDSILGPPRMTNPRYLFLSGSDFSGPFIRKLLHQLFGCSDSLEILWLDGMNLKPIERDLNELLEDIVPHHEAGSAQRKLRLWLGKDPFDNYDKEEMYRTNLSEVFLKSG